MKSCSGVYTCIQGFSKSCSVWFFVVICSNFCSLQHAQKWQQIQVRMLSGPAMPLWEDGLNFDSTCKPLIEALSIEETWHHSDMKQQQIQQVQTASRLKACDPKHRLCQNKIMLVRCGQRSISSCSWSACAAACKRENICGKWTKLMEKCDFQSLSIKEYGWNDGYGTFAESFAAVWSSLSNSTTKADFADSCSINCLNSN